MEAKLLLIVIMMIGTAVFVVTAFERLNLSPVLGYLVAGTILGDNGLRITSFDQTSFLGEFGVVFLLFAIGLELSIERLKAMRRYVFGLGSLQILITAGFIAGLVTLLSSDHKEAITIAGGLALSSTAIVIQVLNETKSQSMQVGRIAIAILLLQDFVVVPMLVIVPLFGSEHGSSIILLILGALIKASIALVTIFIAGRLLLRPFFKLILPENNEGKELPIAVTLLIVLSASWGTEHFGLSLALGAFVAGVLVAETEFRKIAEESIYPFKSLFLGLFFMSVGMKIDVVEIYSNIAIIVSLTIALILFKTLVVSALCIAFRFHKGTALHAGLLLSQGGEFAFVLFGLGKEHGVLSEAITNILLLVVTCSMALTPLLALIGRKISDRLEKKLGRTPIDIMEYGTKDLVNHVVISGFGSVGKMVARVLALKGINYVAIEANDEIVREGVAEHLPVFRGNASQLATLNAIGADRASSFVITTSDKTTLKKSVHLIRKTFPNLALVVNLKDLSYLKVLKELGVTSIVPSDYELGLQLGCTVLKSVGVSEYTIAQIKKQFRSNSYLVETLDLEIKEVKKEDENN